MTDWPSFPRTSFDELADKRGHPDPRSVKIDHPDFLYLSNRGKDAYPVVVFDRSTYRQKVKPTPEQLEEYERNKEIVEAHGGKMRIQEWEKFIRNDLFTEEECELMKQLVLEALPDWEIRETWNGVGTVGYSISIKRKED